MIYSLSEAIQLVVLAILFAMALVRALRVRNATWTTLVCFYACMLLGNIFWYGYLVVFGDFPRYSYISDLGWIASYIFLVMVLVECDQRRGPIAPIRVAWLPVAACAACCVLYIALSGSPLLNIVDNGLMAAIGFFAVRGIAVPPEKRQGSGLAANRTLHVAALAFMVVEQALWLSSLIPDPGLYDLLYTSFNYALTLSYAAILVGAWRSDDA